MVIVKWSQGWYVKTLYGRICALQNICNLSSKPKPVSKVQLFKLLIFVFYILKVIKLCNENFIWENISFNMLQRNARDAFKKLMYLQYNVEDCAGLEEIRKTSENLFNELWKSLQKPCRRYGMKAKILKNYSKLQISKSTCMFLLQKRYHYTCDFQLFCFRRNSKCKRRGKAVKEFTVHCEVSLRRVTLVLTD